MATEKQIAANRLNALKSTGPRTPQGKLVSSLNNTRHGMLAKSLLIRGESAERFQALLVTLYHCYQPRNAVENSLVDILAAARWRQMRLISVETSAINFEIDRQSPADATYDAPTRAHFAMRTLAADTHHAQNMHRHITRNDRQFASAFEKLRRLKREQPVDKNALAPPGHVDPEPDFSSGFPSDDPNDDPNPISDPPDEASDPEQPESSQSVTPSRQTDGNDTDNNHEPDVAHALLRAASRLFSTPGFDIITKGAIPHTSARPRGVCHARRRARQPPASAYRDPINETVLMR